jgi:glycosyltransferase involved in cell wall biosynthesis
MNSPTTRIGFISTRFAGKDGVSLETEKWVKVLEGMGHECFFFAGESIWPDERSMVVEEAHFHHPQIQQISADLFGDFVRSPETSRQVYILQQHLKQQLYTFKQRFDLGLLVVQNALAIPMNVPLGLAITEFIAETHMPTIAHHHDFTWERVRYTVNAAEDYLNAAFPPTLRTIDHVVINSSAQRQLARRRGVSSAVVPNVMNFDADPPAADNHIKAEIRKRLGIPDDDFLLLQPTRIVPRKRIERSIELVKKLDLPCTLLISHEAGDEGLDYVDYLCRLIELLNVRVCFAADQFDVERVTKNGEIVKFGLADAYLAADLVTYPSAIEGFGNAFLEAIYYCRPIVVGAYEIYQLDIAPKGFQVIEFDEFITGEVVERTRELLLRPELVQEQTQHNYQVGRLHFSFANLEHALNALLSRCLGR